MIDYKKPKEFPDLAVLKIGTKKGYMLQYNNETKEIKVVERDVPCTIVRSTDPNRATYNLVKKLYKNFNDDLRKDLKGEQK
jgi:hypothetical protein